MCLLRMDKMIQFFYKLSDKSNRMIIIRAQKEDKNILLTPCMPYYLKIAFHNKTKKFIVPNPKVISLQQIKNIFLPPIPHSAKLSFQLIEPSKNIIKIAEQQQLIEYLKTHDYPDKSSVKIIVEEKDQHSEEEDNNMELEGVLLSMRYKRSRSKSEEIHNEYSTSDFDIEATQEFIYHSMAESNSKLEEAEQFLKMIEKKAQEIKKEKRETDVENLLSFLNSKD